MNTSDVSGQSGRHGTSQGLDAASALWVFGYGSLIWRPGFAFLEQRPARVMGYHRSLCVRSFVHRGTPERPGLVFGLDRGGACTGMAFRVAPGDEDKVIAYLREREQVTSVYLERYLQLQFIVQDTRTDQDIRSGQNNGSGRQDTSNGLRPRALTYVVDRSHPQYAARQPHTDLLQQVMGAVGISGHNPDYVTQTHDALVAMGVSDRTLNWLANEIRAKSPAS